MLVKDAPFMWNQLKGLICIYKPAETKVSHIRNTIVSKICKELNEMECRPPIDYVSIASGENPDNYNVVVQPNFADHPLVVGPRYQMDDLKCSWSNYLGFVSSGILLFGLRSGTNISKTIRENYPTRAYRIKGVFGTATENSFKNGKIVEKSTYFHVKLHNLERFLANMQAAHQRKMFDLCGVDIQSQAAYELATSGLIRPVNSKLPILYGIKCVDFKLPEFTIEIQCVNEYEKYLMVLINEIGLKMHSTAHCTGIQCIRHSYFNIDNALLRKDWTLQGIINNMETCERILSENENLMNQKAVLN